MTRPAGANQALRTAGALRRLFHDLFGLSARQIDALERSNFDELESLLGQKSALLNLVPAAIHEGRRLGWELHDPSTYPADRSCSSLLNEAADYARRLQAHERYVTGQMVVRRHLLGDRLDSLMNTRQAAAGYRLPESRGRSVDQSR